MVDAKNTNLIYSVCDSYQHVSIGCSHVIVGNRHIRCVYAGYSQIHKICPFTVILYGALLYAPEKRNTVKLFLFSQKSPRHRALQDCKIV